jgi:LysR family hydrogen peroxide-inducible transcriptional activator
MNFKQLEYIVAIDEHKVFSEAAYSCNVTQATLSAMVIKLENELGFQIFDRTTKPVTTTESGKELITKAKEMLRLKDTIDQIGRQVPTSISGELRIGIIPTIANSLLSKVLPVLMRNNPKLNLVIKEVTTVEVVRGLKRGTLDFGIAATPIDDDNIQEEIMYYEPMLVYGVANGQKEYTVSEDLLNDKIWLLEEGHCFREQVATVCGLQEKKNTLENLVFEGNSFETLLSMVDAFGGHTLIPELYYRDLDKARKDKSRMFQKPIPVREISILSYGPSKKTLTSQYLASEIRQIISPHLSTSDYQNKDLRIIGIYSESKS